MGRGLGSGSVPAMPEDRVEEYLEERGINGRGLLEEARRECLDRKRWRICCCGHPLGVVHKGSEASVIDRLINITRYVLAFLMVDKKIWRGA